MNSRRVVLGSRLLPVIDSRAEYQRLYPDDAVWLPAARAVCARHGLDAANLQRLALGTHLVFRAGDCVIKLYSPVWAEDHRCELLALQGIVGLPVPHLLGQGELEGWPYLLMSAVPGQPAGELWEALEDSQRVRVMTALGGLLRALHGQRAPAALDARWEAFLAQRIAGAEAHHGVEGGWRDWLRDRLARFRPAAATPVLLHADITADHVLLQRDGTEWSISALIDFGDARVGHPHYDFVAPLACLAFGRPHLARALLAGYGLRLTAALADELTTFCLLHEFGRLADFQRTHPVADGAAFERALWGQL